MTPPVRRVAPECREVLDGVGVDRGIVRVRCARLVQGQVAAFCASVSSWCSRGGVRMPISAAASMDRRGRRVLPGVLAS